MLKIEYIDGVLLKNIFIGAANTLEKNKQVVDSLNVFPVPDGDTGTNMSLTMQSAIKQVKSLNSEKIEDIAKAASNGSLMGARGNSGVILSQLFRGFANGLKGVERIDVEILAKAFKLASDTAYKAVMKPIEGTILTVARECAEKAAEIAVKENDIIKFLEEVIRHGEMTLQKTPEMLPVLKQAGVVDAGGKGLLYILLGALDVITIGDSVLLEEDTEVEAENSVNIERADEDIKFGYCTEFIINSKNVDVDRFKQEIMELGDSLLVVNNDEVTKVHIHTNNPGIVLEKALAIGELINVKIDNMRYQHKNKIIEEEKAVELNRKKYGFIAVAMGEGIANVFKDLNVDFVIHGGQTMNPSTEDILKAVESINAEHIIILPNNSNIILAANQAKELSNANIEVLPTKSIPQGISAILNFDEELELEENINNMMESIKSVKTGQVTFAVRDTVVNDIEIKKDDIIGIGEGEIKSVGNDITEVSINLLKDIVDEDNDLITLYFGEDISEEEAEELAEIIEDEIEDCDVEVVYGGQPLYYYIFSIE
ncbi:dihydroxyacetone kinase [Caloranaerobacter azorensis H53214]|uniref:Dihydroxyacetone kinase n=1 Tax=Caloranaerobacter azorensis H53214 TaxID=1156417 RepID=A0A096BJV2_9FIRM|nr:DAK2 domain-containing protein [Caloranaerobacter azorensis]KGG81127.1 dihydroxyacetone kinase [Caloranaerobacter azorensis H53214]